MTKEVMNELRNRAFQAKTQEEWTNVMLDIKNILEGEDDNTKNYLRQYCGNLLKKKKEYWSKYSVKEKKQYPIKKTVLLDENLSKKIEEYMDLLILQKKLELQERFNINL